MNKRVFTFCLLLTSSALVLSCGVKEAFAPNSLLKVPDIQVSDGMMDRVLVFDEGIVFLWKQGWTENDVLAVAHITGQIKALSNRGIELVIEEKSEVLKKKELLSEFSDEDRAAWSKMTDRSQALQILSEKLEVEMFSLKVELETKKAQRIEKASEQSVVLAMISNREQTLRELDLEIANLSKAKAEGLILKRESHESNHDDITDDLGDLDMDLMELEDELRKILKANEDEKCLKSNRDDGFGLRLDCLFPEEKTVGAKLTAAQVQAEKQRLAKAMDAVRDKMGELLDRLTEEEEAIDRIDQELDDMLEELREAIAKHEKTKNEIDDLKKKLSVVNQTLELIGGELSGLRVKLEENKGQLLASRLESSEIFKSKQHMSEELFEFEISSFEKQKKRNEELSKISKTSSTLSGKLAQVVDFLPSPKNVKFSFSDESPLEIEMDWELPNCAQDSCHFSTENGKIHSVKYDPQSGGIAFLLDVIYLRDSEEIIERYSFGVERSQHADPFGRISFGGSVAMKACVLSSASECLEKNKEGDSGYRDGYVSLVERL